LFFGHNIPPSGIFYLFLRYPLLSVAILTFPPTARALLSGILPDRNFGLTERHRHNAKEWDEPTLLLTSFFLA
ncbi:MAG: hypothetical protein AAGU23_04430, partial [Bacillota bacterium]